MKPAGIVVALAASLAFAAGAAEPIEHHHGHEPGHEAGQLQLDHGKKWPTDQALRTGMAAMRGELAAKLPAIHQGKLSAADYADLGKAIEARVGEVVSQCKLVPQADAMLHIVIADLVASADVMQGKAAGQPAAAAHQAVEALNAYGRYFDHPAWQPLR